MARSFRTVRFFDRTANRRPTALDGSTLRVSRGFSSVGPILCFSLEMPLRDLNTIILTRIQANELRTRIDGFLGVTLPDLSIPPLWEDEEEVD